MKIFFDTEFTGLHKDTTLVSIGMITEQGESLYAEFTDFDKSYDDVWFKKNVLNNLKYIGNVKRSNIIADVELCGTKERVVSEIRKWLEKFDDITLVSDVCHYDMVLFIDLFGTAFDLPKNICPSCHDINQDIAKYLNISEKEAFDYSREDLVKDTLLANSQDKHNSLYDARVIKYIYELIHIK